MRSKKHILYTALSLFLFVFFASCSSQKVIEPISPWAKSTTAPQRLLLITIDQFQEEYIDSLNLKHFKSFREKSLRFPNAWTGHLPSIKVMSHAVLSTGLLPKNLPFQDRIFNDTTGILGKKGALYSIDHLKRKEFEKLLKHTAETNLHTRLKYGHRGDTFTVSTFPSNAYALGSPYSDLLISLDSPKKNPPMKGWCFPFGVDVPDYFLFPQGGRFYLDCSNPQQSNPLIWGTDEKHLGGDSWVTDSVLEIVKQEADWRAIFADFPSLNQSLSSVAQNDNSINGFRNTLIRLDEQFGKIIQALEEKNLLKETLIVVTSTHGGQAVTHYHGVWSSPNLQGTKIVGKLENFSADIVPPELSSLQKTNLIRAMSLDSTLKFFLSTNDSVKVSKLAVQISSLPGVSEVYTRQDRQYVRTYRHKELTGALLDWAREKNQELISTLNNRNGPDIVALLFPGYGYGQIGETGSTLKGACQKIPVFIWSPNVEPKENPYPIRVVDINPVVSRLMSITLPVTLDGSKAAIDSSILDP